MLMVIQHEHLPMPPAPVGPSQQFEHPDAPRGVFFISPELLARVRSDTTGLNPKEAASSKIRINRVLGLLSLG